MNHSYVERVVDLLPEGVNRILNLTVEEARARLLSGQPEAVMGIHGSFALVAKQGKTVRLARSLDRPMRYFLAKRAEGPALVVADRMDVIKEWLDREGLHGQFHPSYTRMVPAHYIAEIELIGCPDPDPIYTRYFTPSRNALPPDLDAIGAAYIGAMAQEIQDWLKTIPADAPVGVCFSGGIDSGAVFFVTYHVMRKLGLNPARLKAFTLTDGAGEDLVQAREFLKRLDLELFLEAIEFDPRALDVRETVKLVEDYKPLDVESATMALALLHGIRQRYPDWKYLLDGEGGDENLKDYPIEENPELTIHSVINNLMLYQEGWGVGRIKHSLTYSGGLSRAYTRSYAPLVRYHFEGFSPQMRPSVVGVAEAIPFAHLTSFDVPTLYSLKGEIVSRGVKAVTGMELPVFAKRRFQHGALPMDRLRAKVPADEARLRKMFYELYP